MDQYKHVTIKMFKMNKITLKETVFAFLAMMNSITKHWKPLAIGATIVGIGGFGLYWYLNFDSKNENIE